LNYAVCFDKVMGTLEISEQPAIVFMGSNPLCQLYAAVSFLVFFPNVLSHLLGLKIHWQLESLGSNRFARSLEKADIYKLHSAILRISHLPHLHLRVTTNMSAQVTPTATHDLLVPSCHLTTSLAAPPMRRCSQWQ
jgi:hypothetical protein